MHNVSTHPVKYNDINFFYTQLYVHQSIYTYNYYVLIKKPYKVFQNNEHISTRDAIIQDTLRFFRNNDPFKIISLHANKIGNV